MDFIYIIYAKSQWINFIFVCDYIQIYTGYLFSESFINVYKVLYSYLSPISLIYSPRLHLLLYPLPASCSLYSLLLKNILSCPVSSAFVCTSVESSAGTWAAYQQPYPKTKCLSFASLHQLPIIPQRGVEPCV